MHVTQVMDEDWYPVQKHRLTYVTAGTKKILENWLSWLLLWYVTEILAKLITHNIRVKWKGKEK